jgi:hypothetical protein
MPRGADVVYCGWAQVLGALADSPPGDPVVADGPGLAPDDPLEGERLEDDRLEACALGMTAVFSVTTGIGPGRADAATAGGRVAPVAPGDGLRGPASGAAPHPARTAQPMMPIKVTVIRRIRDPSRFGLGHSRT